MFEKLDTYIREFISLSQAEWHEVTACFQPYFLNKNDYLIQAGNVCNYVYFINSGGLRMFYIEDGKDITRFFTFEGHFASALTSFLTREPSLENIQVLEDCELLKISYDDLQKLYLDVPAWQKLGRKILEKAYVISTRRIESLICLNATQRYLNLLETYPNLFERVPQHHIATYLGVEPETLSRIRKKLSQRTIS